MGSFNPKALLADAYRGRRTLQAILADDLAQSNLCILLGAGVSRALRLPLWSELVESLFREEGSSMPPGLSLPDAASEFRRQYCAGRSDELLGRVRRLLYATADMVEVFAARPTLVALGALLAGSRQFSGVTNVISFNYDDVLEAYLELNGVVVQSIIRPTRWAQQGDVDVYHPHGFLPLGEHRRSSPTIVLDSESCADYLSDSGGGAEWRNLLLPLLRSHVCLFVGIRGADEALLRLLRESMSNNAALESGRPVRGVWLTMEDDPDLVASWEKVAVVRHGVADYEADLPSFLIQIAQLTAARRLAGMES